MSKVRSLPLDRMEKATLSMFTTIGNVRANAVLEKCVNDKKIHKGVSKADSEAFIIDHYCQKVSIKTAIV